MYNVLDAILHRCQGNLQNYCTNNRNIIMKTKILLVLDLYLLEVFYQIVNLGTAQQVMWSKIKGMHFWTPFRKVQWMFQFTRHLNKKKTMVFCSVWKRFKLSLIIRRDVFICWITLSADLKNWDFKKKQKKTKKTRKTKDFAQHCHEIACFQCDQKSSLKIIILKNHSGLVNCTKIMIFRVHVFFFSFLRSPIWKISVCVT